LDDVIAVSGGRISSEGGEEIPPEVAENPDAEDPRLYSPLQEADRPAPELRIQPEEETKEETKEEQEETAEEEKTNE